jgi:type VI secretion system protein ImpA
LDFAALTAPIPGDNPRGAPVPFEIRRKLEESRIEDFEPPTPKPDGWTPKKADWAGIVKLTQEMLAKTSKDLLVSARLTEALVKLHGFAGLRDGLRLMRELVEQCWDRLNPPIEEEEDVERRAGPFNWLDDPDKGARFPTTIRSIPLVTGKDGQYAWIDWKRSQDPKPPIPKEAIDKAILETPEGVCAGLAQDIAQSLEDLDKLTQSLKRKMGEQAEKLRAARGLTEQDGQSLKEKIEGQAPALLGLKQAAEDCHMLMRQILERKRPAVAAKTDIPSGGPSAPPSAPAAARPAATRAEAYQQLRQAAALLKELEPHSPVPYFIERAVELGSLRYPELIKELVRDQNILKELNREMGIKEPPAPPAAPKK